MEIILNGRQKKLIAKQLKGEYDPFLSSEHDQEEYNNVIHQMELLMHELKAYEESGENPLEWFWEKYQQQQKQV
jgi:peptide subunit release factor 1 (eRF1)